ncbi:alpha/beta fold hydrolase [Pseudanabaenaceae cyanobacterium LEGE 13415]|nr:alpha/beta fold hydrolase [Pseudanabaenaceae cyanobacterium LEGE 13415]
MKRHQIGLLILAGILIVLSWWGIFSARSGLTVRSLNQDKVPLLYLAPQSLRSVPGVLVAHGYSGSKQLMLAYGHVLARSGYAVMLWDWDGHGANPNRLENNSLRRNFETAWNALAQQPEVDATRLAVVGHSMGSGAVMDAAIAHPGDFFATVGISPTGANVTPERPRNLQLQAGSWEGGFIRNAERILQQAGGTNPDVKYGRGREFVLVPNVEHITILFNSVSHTATRDWLDRTFGSQQQSSYVDRRMLWQAVHLIGWLMVLTAVMPNLQIATSAISISSLQRWGGLLLSSTVPTAGLVLLDRITDLQTLGGIQVGGAVALWFLIAGLLWLAVLRQIPQFNLRKLLLGIGVFTVLWIAVGAMAQFVWLQSVLIPERLLIWGMIAIASLPWFLGSEIAQSKPRIIWGIAQSVALIGGFVLVLQFLPQLGFMFILLPLFPVLLTVLTIVATQVRESWSVAIASALFFAWLLAAGFPLA